VSAVIELTKRRPVNFSEVVRQRELGVPDYVTNGDFLDAFYAAPLEQKQSFLDVEPPETDCDAITGRSLALFAATAEKLAHEFGLDVPAWVNKQRYFLDNEDIAGYRADDLPPGLVAILRTEAPVEFARRNLFVSDNVLTRM
jgi:hypothetical protein